MWSLGDPRQSGLTVSVDPHVLLLLMFSTFLFPASPPSLQSEHPSGLLKTTMRHHNHFLVHFLVRLLSFLLQFDASPAYSLKNCIVECGALLPGVCVTCAGHELTTVPEDIPSDATSLDLTNNQIDRINATHLGGLRKLVRCVMSTNSIEDVAEGAFADLAELTHLDLSNNFLTNLTDGMFRGLSSLLFLSLDENLIRRIPPLVFQPLISLQTARLSSNHFLQISDVLPILQLPNLYELWAAECSIASLESDHLPFYKSNLRILDFSSNPLRRFSITRDVFPDLQSLDLSECGSDFEWDVPDRSVLKSVTHLYLSGVKMSFETYSTILQTAESVEFLRLRYMEELLDKGLINVACQIPALTRLDLTSNVLNILNDSLLQSCANVTELTLDSNLISDLSENSLRPLNRLKRLKLEYNFLTKVPLAIRGLSTLVVLSLSFNDIVELGCSDFLNLTSLRQLSLDQNHISTLRGCTFRGLKNLRLLHIEENPIVRMNDFPSLQNLRVLNMNGNKLVEVGKGDFGSLSSLQVLDFASVSDYSVNIRTFEGLDSLRSLTLTPFTLRQEMFKGLPLLENLTLYLPTYTSSLSCQVNDEPIFLNVPSLRMLTIQNNNKWDIDISPDLLRGLDYLEYFAAEKFFPETPHPDTFTFTPRLTALRIISSNVSNPEPEVFRSIQNLKALDLSRNKLRSLGFLARVNLSALRRLTLRDNELTALNESVFQSLPALTYLDLSGNPFTCGCSNVGFIQWAKSNTQTQVVNGHQYTCSSPPSQQGAKLLDFDLQSCWLDVNFLCFTCSTGLTLLTLLASFIYHFLRWHLAYSFHLFLAFLYDRTKRKTGAPPHRYDAFISYNVHDEAWVHAEMLPVLEGEQGWRLCLHHRDFQPGRPITDNITDAIYGSRKTICVISRHYLQSEWCSWEIQMASFRLFDEQKDVLILLFLEEIPAHQLSPDYRIRKLVKRRTYLSWPPAGRHTGVFWQNVRRALETGDAPNETADLPAGLARC